MEPVAHRPLATMVAAVPALTTAPSAGRSRPSAPGNDAGSSHWPDRRWRSGCATACPRAGTGAARPAPGPSPRADGAAPPPAGLPTGVNDRRDEVQNPDVHGRSPYLPSHTWAATAQTRRSGLTQPKVVLKTASKL